MHMFAPHTVYKSDKRKLVERILLFQMFPFQTNNQKSITAMKLEEKPI